MTELVRGPLGPALLGALVGGLLTLAGGYVILKLQEEKERKHEVWLRALNSYQDFVHAVRMFARTTSFSNEWTAIKSDSLMSDTIVLAFKCLDDARTLDPHGSDRVEEMRDILSGLLASNQTPDSTYDSASLIELQRRSQAVYMSFADEHGLSQSSPG